MHQVCAAFSSKVMTKKW